MVVSVWTWGIWLYPTKNIGTSRLFTAWRCNFEAHCGKTHGSSIFEMPKYLFCSMFPAHYQYITSTMCCCFFLLVPIQFLFMTFCFESCSPPNAYPFPTTLSQKWSSSQIKKTRQNMPKWNKKTLATEAMVCFKIITMMIDLPIRTSDFHRRVLDLSRLLGCNLLQHRGSLDDIHLIMFRLNVTGPIYYTS